MEYENFEEGVSSHFHVVTLGGAGVSVFCFRKSCSRGVIRVHLYKSVCSDTQAVCVSVKNFRKIQNQLLQLGHPLEGFTV